MTGKIILLFLLFNIAVGAHTIFIYLHPPRPPITANDRYFCTHQNGLITTASEEHLLATYGIHSARHLCLRWASLHPRRVAQLLKA